MKIRHLLLLLTILLGAALLATVAALIRVQAEAYFDARQLFQSNAIRERLLLLERRVMRERTHTYVSLILGGSRAEILEIRGATDLGGEPDGDRPGRQRVRQERRLGFRSVHARSAGFGG
jgi:hypothetical protein